MINYFEPVSQNIRTRMGTGMKNKKRQADYIAPLQPLTLAAFPPWEGSAGAGRVRPAGRKYTEATTISNP
jgi:hypothetical protein